MKNKNKKIKIMKRVQNIPRRQNQWMKLKIIYAIEFELLELSMECKR
jgi:hypothetical protein